MEQQIENMDLAPNMLRVSLGRQRIQAKNLKKFQIKGKISGTQKDHYRI